MNTCGVSSPEVQSDGGVRSVRSDIAKQYLRNSNNNPGYALCTIHMPVEGATTGTAMDRLP